MSRKTKYRLRAKADTRAVARSASKRPALDEPGFDISWCLALRDKMSHDPHDGGPS